MSFLQKYENYYISCNDGILNGQEIAIDCGGPVCPSCYETCLTNWIGINSMGFGVQDLEVTDNNLLVAGVGTSNDCGIAFYDGSNWNFIGTGFEGGYIYDVEPQGTSNFIVGGWYANAGGNSGSNSVSIWDGTNWINLDQGIDGIVTSVKYFNNEIYIGGGFEDAYGNSNMDNVAKWNGMNWVPLSTGINGVIESICEYNGNLVFGGTFTQAGGTSNTTNIAVWNGSSWQALGGGLNNTVTELIEINGQLNVAGNFTNAGGNPNADRIAKWNGSTWENLSTGIATGAGVIYGMYNYDGYLYVTGNFSSIGGNNNAGNNAYWNGALWSPVVSNSQIGVFSGYGSTIAFIGGDMFVGGGFSINQGGPYGNNIAFWRNKNMVMTTYDSLPGSLRYEINCASANDTIRFHSTLVDDTLLINTAPLNIYSNVNIINNLGEMIEISCTGNNYTLYNESSNLHIENLTIISCGNNNELGIVNNGNLFLKNVLVKNKMNSAPHTLLENYGYLEINGNVDIK